MVEFKDGVIFAQMGVSDMRVPIKYALEYPNHTSHELFQTLDLTKIKTLNFEEVYYDRYPLVKCAIDAVKKGGINTTILNAANEAAVKLFLEDKISFLMIEEIIKEALSEATSVSELSLEVILETEKNVREKIIKKYERGI
jgi:1-deoxy-D-xylulose-5-phosphate reductoisomerase